MKLLSPKRTAALLFLLLLAAAVPFGTAVEWDGYPGTVLQGYEYVWEGPESLTPFEAAGLPAERWSPLEAEGHVPEEPPEAGAVWLRVPLPATPAQSVLSLERIYGSDLQVYRNQTLIYESLEPVRSGGSKLLIPLTGAEGEGMLYLRSSGGHIFGVDGDSRVGAYNQLLGYHIKRDLVDLIIGAALIFMAVVLLLGLMFLRLDFFAGGFWLMLVVLSLGVMLIAYSPVLPLVMHGGDRWIEVAFDLALYTLLPSFTLYFEKMFYPEGQRWLRLFRNIQIAYSLACLGLMVANSLLSFRMDHLYRLFSVGILGVVMMGQLVVLLLLALSRARRHNRSAIYFTAGFGVFAVITLGELLAYYLSSGSYQLYWWKWGIVVFIVALIVVLGQKFAENYKRTLSYSKELEKLGNELQRSEKMEMISELAASVAHEVRNPLQVTRGFLQILGERSGQKEKEYLQMALQELDRASVIITDFLTFAKPVVETVDGLDVEAELRHVAGIMVPLAHLQGGSIELHLQSGLQVLGSSSKFKQAFINLIKNSIESLQENGVIRITAWKSGQHIIISIKDNGEGMKVSELARLGEPFYSNKSKGTGLGLMVTFRIIEAMDGTVQFQSAKGKGTEVIVKLPLYGNIEKD
ncbi:sensor histidine kinase [Paenibacillus tepidiphilus]|uniref:sensor histidine kinase n=1 Tax=Paenibacillus tepidiphilus TaxID=2608683 RepID=UPI00123A7BEF|nr:sensor histidine kinase [Paenibacillus tepidiphilus]